MDDSSTSSSSSTTSSMLEHDEAEMQHSSLPDRSQSPMDDSPCAIISVLLDHLLGQVESTFGTAPKSAEIDSPPPRNSTTRTLRSHVRKKCHLPITVVQHRRGVNRRRPSPPTPETIESIQDVPASDSAPIPIEPLASDSFDIESLPPNKRRLRERTAAATASTESKSPDDRARDSPINSIEQFLKIRQQINKRHDDMLLGFVPPAVPKEFADSVMAKKSYLVAPSRKSCPLGTPASFGIQRVRPPEDLDEPLADLFTRQEDERYRMKLRHQVERDKLLLSHEQEVLRLHGNATRSSINQETPLSYCSWLRDNEVYDHLAMQERSLSFIANDYINSEFTKRNQPRWNGRSLLKWLEDCNVKYKRLSCEINQRQCLEATTLYAMQRMVWLKHLPKETARSADRYLPRVEINAKFWTDWQLEAF